MMKNVAMVVALALALVCSQACAQKKTESASTTKASSSKSETSKQDAPDATKVASKSKQTKAEGEPAEAVKTKSTKKKDAAGKEAAEKVAPKSDSSEELTDEQQKKIKSMLRQTLKPFAEAELTEEQRQKADEVFGKAIKDYVVKRSKAMITDELQKKQVAAMKEAKASGKSAREQTKAAFTTAGFSDEQVKVFKATQTSLTKAKKDFAKTLTEKQIESLPEQLQAMLKGEEK